MIFDRPFNEETGMAHLKSKQASLSLYITDFYWYQKEKPDYYVESPVDCLWRICDLGECSEQEMTFGGCKFIITSSYQMVENGFPVDDKWENVRINHELIRTQEDMYYYALIQLYWLYMLERKTNE